MAKSAKKGHRVETHFFPLFMFLITRFNTIVRQSTMQQINILVLLCVIQIRIDDTFSIQLQKNWN